MSGCISVRVRVVTVKSTGQSGFRQQPSGKREEDLRSVQVYPRMPGVPRRVYALHAARVSRLPLQFTRLFTRRFLDRNEGGT